MLHLVRYLQLEHNFWMDCTWCQAQQGLKRSEVNTIWNTCTITCANKKILFQPSVQAVCLVLVKVERENEKAHDIPGNQGRLTGTRSRAIVSHVFSHRKREERKSLLVECHFQVQVSSPGERFLSWLLRKLDGEFAVFRVYVLAAVTGDWNIYRTEKSWFCRQELHFEVGICNEVSVNF